MMQMLPSDSWTIRLKFAWDVEHVIDDSDVSSVDRDEDPMLKNLPYYCNSYVLCCQTK